jgi:hypothetical protein
MNMALFKKKESTLEELIETINSLSDEEKQSLKDMLDNPQETTEEEPTTETAEETTEEVEEATEEGGEETEIVEEETTVEEEAPIEETTEEVVEEEVDEEAPQEITEEVTEDAPTDNIRELYTMIEELKKVVEGLSARINAEDENENPFEAFGISPQSFGQEAEETGEVEKMKTKYWNL